jgi:hypothetical protein
MSIKEDIKKEENKKTPKMPAHTKEEERLNTLMLNTIDAYRTLIFPEAYEIIKAKLLFT